MLTPTRAAVLRSSTALLLALHCLPAEAGGHHPKGQLIAVPMQGQAVAPTTTQQMSFSQPVQMSSTSSPR